MLTNVSQRWRAGRDKYRPAGEVIDTSKYEVAPITVNGKPADKPAKDFVQKHHYSGTMPAARERVGLYRGGIMVGCAVFSVPCRMSVLDCLPCPRDAAVELGRFVLLDDVPGNGETWFLARCFEYLRREGYEGVVSFSDPMPRTDATGRIVFKGHLGGIYQSSNAVYAGRASARTQWLLPDGSVFSERAMSKVRGRERGWRYSVDQLVAHGAPQPSVDDLAAWLREVKPLVLRPFRHAGNHKYLIGLTKSVKRRLPASLPYPKLNLPTL